MGHELRQYVRYHSQPDNLVTQCVHSGQLVPEQALVDIIGLSLQRSDDDRGCPVVMDGLPRHASQIDPIHDKVCWQHASLSQIVTSEQIGLPDRVICFECPKEIARDRVLMRKDTSRVDNEEIFERRYTQFCSDNPAIVARYEAEGKLVRVS